MPSSTASSPAGYSAPPGYGSSSGTSTSPASASPPSSSTAAVCPDHNNQTYTTDNSSYNISCGQSYTGRVISTSGGNSTAQKPGSYAPPPTYGKRQATAASSDSPMTVQSCMALCDANTECVAITLGCAGDCTLYATTTGSFGSASCTTSAKRVAVSSGGASVVTVSVCRASTSRRTTTVFTTATTTTCDAATACTDGMIGRLGRKEE